MNDILDNLQRIEVGLEQAILPNIPLWDGNYICGKKNVSTFNQINNTCQVCHILEPLIWHHIYTKTVKNKTSTSGTTKRSDFGELLGLVHICPNCHYMIHTLNPYINKKDNK